MLFDYPSSSLINPILRLGFCFGSLDCNSANASVMLSSCRRVLSLISFWSRRISSMSSFSFSNSLRNCATSFDGFEGGRNAAKWRNSTKARIISRFTLIAVFDLSTLPSIATPSSVKTLTRYLVPPRPLFSFYNIKPSSHAKRLFATLFSVSLSFFFHITYRDRIITDVATKMLIITNKYR